jgi:hypothetical protein
MPPAPVQVREYVLSAVNVPVLWLPLVANAPAQPPEALHDVALAELQANIAVPPLLMAVGDADIDAVGADGLVVRGADPDPDPPQAARSSAAPIVIIGAKHRIRVLSSSRIMSVAGLYKSGSYRGDDGRPAGAFKRRIKRHPSAGSIT